jgi:hypothetical protein
LQVKTQTEDVRRGVSKNALKIQSSQTAGSCNKIFHLSQREKKKKRKQQKTQKPEIPKYIHN